jgi:AcrR family transcriptional regulator
MDMSIPYEQAGRRQQKARTRQALVDAARTLVSGGLTPTVEEAAAEARISRTTAYRYFPNQRALLLAAYPHIESSSLLTHPAPADPEERLAAVVDAHTRQTVQMEPQLRTMLRLSLEATPDERGQLLLRRGRAIGWIEDALAPLRGRLTDDELHQLALAIRTVEGIDALVWLTDVAGLPRPAAVRLMRWAAVALLRSALTDGPPPTRQ